MVGGWRMYVDGAVQYLTGEVYEFTCRHCIEGSYDRRF